VFSRLPVVSTTPHLQSGIGGCGPGRPAEARSVRPAGDLDEGIDGDGRPRAQCSMASDAGLPARIRPLVVDLERLERYEVNS
jgi:hypothetical protein